MRRPGEWLRAAAARVCATRTMERVVDPVIGDIQREHEEALRAGYAWRVFAIRIGGYLAFWRAVSLHVLYTGPSTLWKAIADDEWALGRMLGYSLLLFVGLTLVFGAPPMIDIYPRTQQPVWMMFLLLPQAIPLSIPIALPLAIACVKYSGRGPRRLGGVVAIAMVATLGVCLAMVVLPTANQAYRVAVAQELGFDGVTLSRGANESSLSELARGRETALAAGLTKKARTFAWVYHLRFALPFSALVLSLFAIGIARNLRRRALRLLALVLAIGLYWAILARAGWNADLPPIVAVWAPNVIFMAMSLVLLRSRSPRLTECPR